MFFTANQLGKRMDDLGKGVDDLRVDVRELRSEFYAFKDVVNGKFASLDTEIGRLLDRRNPQ
jgi:CHAD domain-containing protein